MAKKVTLEVDLDTSRLTRAIEESEDAVKNLGTSGQKTVQLLDQATGGLATKFVQAKAGITGLLKGLNLTKVAIAATGIGLFVTALGSLVAYFTQTKRGAEVLAQAMAGLKATFAVLVDLASSIGEAIYNAFANPKQALIDFGNSIKTYVQDKIDGLLKTFGLLGSAIKKVFSGDFSGAIDDAKEAAKTFVMEATVIGDIVDVGEAVIDTFSGIAQEIGKAASAATRLEKAQQRLIDRQRETLVLTAKERAGIKELNLIAEDTTKSIDERIAAAEEAGDKERELFERRRTEAEEALRIRRAQNALSESTAEDLQREAELEAQLYSLQAESLELQTTLQNKLNSLKAEGIRLAQEAADKEKELAKARLEQENKMLDKLAQARLDAAEENLKIEKELQESRRELFENTLIAFRSLSELFAKDDERNARKAFAISKALGIADASIKTAQAVTDALAKDAIPGVPGSRFAAAAAAGLAGLAQIATIARQQFGSAAQVTAPQAAGGVSPGIPQVPNFESGAFRSYVLATDVNNAQQAQQKIEEQALLL